MKNRGVKHCSRCGEAGHSKTTCVKAEHPADPALAPPWEDLEKIFIAADEMVGGGDPDYFDEERARIRRVRRQLRRAMGLENDR